MNQPVLAIALALLCLTPITVHPAPATPPPKDISALLIPIIAKHDIPGIAAAVVRNRERFLIAIGPIPDNSNGTNVA